MSLWKYKLKKGIEEKGPFFIHTSWLSTLTLSSLTCVCVCVCVFIFFISKSIHYSFSFCMWYGFGLDGWFYRKWVCVHKIHIKRERDCYTYAGKLENFLMRTWSRHRTCKKKSQKMKMRKRNGTRWISLYSMKVKWRWMLLSSLHVAGEKNWNIHL